MKGFFGCLGGLFQALILFAFALVSLIYLLGYFEHLGGPSPGGNFEKLGITWFCSIIIFSSLLSLITAPFKAISISGFVKDKNSSSSVSRSQERASTRFIKIAVINALWTIPMVTALTWATYQAIDRGFDSFIIVFAWMVAFSISQIPLKRFLAAKGWSQWTAVDADGNITFEFSYSSSDGSGDGDGGGDGGGD